MYVCIILHFSNFLLFFAANSILKQRQKVIRIADESEMGWKVVDEYVQSEIASDEEDQKRIHRAEARASRKVKADRGRKTRTRWTPYRGSRFNHPVRPVATVTSQAHHQQHAPQQGRLGNALTVVKVDIGGLNVRMPRKILS